MDLPVIHTLLQKMKEAFGDEKLANTDYILQGPHPRTQRMTLSSTSQFGERSERTY